MNNIKTQINSLLSTICALNTEEQSEAVCYLERFVNNIQNNATTTSDHNECLFGETNCVNEMEHKGLTNSGGNLCNKVFTTESTLKSICNADSTENITPITEFAEFSSKHKEYKCIHCADSLFYGKKPFYCHIFETHTKLLKNGSLFGCQLCDVIFQDKKLLCRHFKKCHSQSNDANQISKDQQTNNSADAAEIECEQSRSNEECPKFECAHCGRRFMKKNLLTVHLKTHFKNKEFVCEPCKKRFIKYRYYRRHLKSLTHSNNAEIDVAVSSSSSGSACCKCNDCDRIYPHEEALTTHIMKVHRPNDKQRKKCPICNFKTNFRSSFNRHMMLHTSNRQFVCEECGACFNSASALKDHRVGKHSDERNFGCEKCGQTFKLKSSLNRHYKTHSEERNERCSCGLVYKLASNLRKHQLIAHGKVTTKKVIEKVINEDDGYIMNSPNMLKLQKIQTTNEEINCSRNIEDDLDIQPMSVLADVDLSCAGDVLRDGDTEGYNFPDYEEVTPTDHHHHHQNLQQSNNNNMLTPIYLVETVMQQNSNILTNVAAAAANQHHAVMTSSSVDNLHYDDQAFSSDVSYLQAIDLQQSQSQQLNVVNPTVSQYVLQNNLHVLGI